MIFGVLSCVVYSNDVHFNPLFDFVWVEMLPLPLIFQVDTSNPTFDHWTLLLLFEAHILFPDFLGKFEKWLFYMITPL